MSASYTPASGYHRRAIRAARTHAALETIALCLVRETEFLRTWARAQGLQPPAFDPTVEAPVDHPADVVELSSELNRSSESALERPIRRASS